MTFLLVAVGSVVCITNASGGCPDWPRCHGALVPPARMSSILEYSHRVIAMLTGPLIVIAAIAGWRRKEIALRVLPLAAVVLTAAVAVFGAFAVLTGLPPVLAAVDLGSALGVVSFMVIAAVVASLPAGAGGQRAGRRPLATLAMASLAAMFIYQIAGVLLARGSIVRCVGGPLLAAPLSASGWLASGRAALGVAAAILVIATAIAGRHADRATRRWSRLAVGLLGVKAALMVAILGGRTDAPVLVPSAFVAAALWSALVVVATRAAIIELDTTVAAAEAPLARPTAAR